jgi:hypothetical protein
MAILQTLSTPGGTSTTAKTTLPLKATDKTPAWTKKTMKSLRFHGKGDIRVDEIEEPQCRAGWVKVSESVLESYEVLKTPLVCSDKIDVFRVTDEAGVRWDLRERSSRIHRWPCACP